MESDYISEVFVHVFSLLMYIPKHKTLDRVLGFVSEITAQM